MRKLLVYTLQMTDPDAPWLHVQLEDESGTLLDCEVGPDASITWNGLPFLLSFTFNDITVPWDELVGAEIALTIAGFCGSCLSTVCRVTSHYSQHSGTLTALYPLPGEHTPGMRYVMRGPANSDVGHVHSTGFEATGGGAA